MIKLLIHLKINFKSFMLFIKELYQFMKSRKKYWLLPIIIMSAILGLLIVYAQGSAIAPFLYTLF